MKAKRENVVLVFHSSNRSSWHETIAGISRAAAAERWRLQTIDDVVDRKTAAELVDFWRPAGIIAECGVDQKGIFSPAVFGKVPTVYLVCDVRRLDANALRVNHDSTSFGRLAARELLMDDMRGFGYFGFKGLFWSEERGRSFDAALKLNGCVSSHFERPLDESPSKRHKSGGYRTRLAAWLESLPKPCGLLAANDMLAVEAIN
ncbi:MAG: hypothetical protein IKU71_03760, partial [Kiritimatiellae bacterium]|nr:hypothetical protein [Kiritimatiellia bacterium]